MNAPHFVKKTQFGDFFRKLNQSFLLLKKDRIDEEMEEEAKLEEDSRAAKLKT